MKIFTKFLLVILVLGLAGPFILKRPDGRPWMEVDDLLPDVSAITARFETWWSRAIGKVEGLAGEENLDLPSGKTKVYKWRGPDGGWQFSDQPPEGKSEEMWLDPNANVMQSTPLPLPAAEAPEIETANPTENVIPLPLTVSPGQASKLMEDARNVQELMNQRNRDL